MNISRCTSPPSSTYHSSAGVFLSTLRNEADEYHEHYHTTGSTFISIWQFLWGTLQLLRWPSDSPTRLEEFRAVWHKDTWTYNWIMAIHMLWYIDIIDIYIYMHTYNESICTVKCEKNDIYYTYNDRHINIIDIHTSNQSCTSSIMM